MTPAAHFKTQRERSYPLQERVCHQTRSETSERRDVRRIEAYWIRPFGQQVSVSEDRSCNRPAGKIDAEEAE
jgi:hypothetical protein